MVATARIHRRLLATQLVVLASAWVLSMGLIDRWLGAELRRYPALAADARAHVDPAELAVGAACALALVLALAHAHDDSGARVHADMRASQKGAPVPLSRQAGILGTID